MAKLKAMKTVAAAKKKEKLSKENIPPKDESTVSEDSGSSIDETANTIVNKRTGTTAAKAANVEEESHSDTDMEDENDASRDENDSQQTSQTESDEEPVSKKRTIPPKKNIKNAPEPQSESEEETDDDDNMEQESRSYFEAEDEPVQPKKQLPQAKKGGRIEKIEHSSQSESEGDEEDEDQAPQPQPAKKKPVAAKPAPKAVAKPKAMPQMQKRKATAKKVLAPPPKNIKMKETKPPAKVKAATMARLSRVQQKDLNKAALKNKTALPPTKSKASKTTKAAKETKTTAVAVANKTAKSANTTKLDKKLAAVTKAAIKSDRRLSKVSAVITKAQHNKDLSGMTIGDKIIVSIFSLNEDTGSSMRNIINYMSKTYQIDKVKSASRIRAYLKKFYEEGILVQKKNTNFNINRKFSLKSKKYQNMIATNDEDAESYDDDEDVK